MIIIRLIVLLVAVSLCACKGDKRVVDDATPVAKQSNVVQQRLLPAYRPPVAPASLGKEQKAEFMCDHYWDNFDFADSTLVCRMDSVGMLSAFALYAVGYVPEEKAQRYLPRLMQQASASKPMYEYFLWLAQTILHDPNSELRSDERYIPILEDAVQSRWLDEYERMPYEYDLGMARKNRVGRVANDFTYTLASGRQGTLHAIKAGYTLIFISNPGCPMCRDIKEQIVASPLLGGLIERGELKVLVIYPDADLQAWRNHLGDYPAKWINGYDAALAIEKEQLYDLKAIPALYLLDARKRVMAKDCTDVGYIEMLLNGAADK